MPLFNCKVELKIKWINQCVLSAADDVNSSNIIFAIIDTKLYVPVVTLSGGDNQKLSKRLSNVFGYSNADANLKMYKSKECYLPKG